MGAAQACGDPRPGHRSLQEDALPRGARGWKPARSAQQSCAPRRQLRLCPEEEARFSASDKGVVWAGMGSAAALQLIMLFHVATAFDAQAYGRGWARAEKFSDWLRVTGQVSGRARTPVLLLSRGCQADRVISGGLLRSLETPPPLPGGVSLSAEDAAAGTWGLRCRRAPTARTPLGPLAPRTSRSS